MGEDELAAGVVIKEMGLLDGHPDKNSIDVKLADLVAEVRSRLAACSTKETKLIRAVQAVQLEEAVLFLFCFDSVIYTPLHVARRAMVATVPLPLAGQRRAFIKKTFFPPQTSLRGYSEVSQCSFSP